MPDSLMPSAPPARWTDPREARLAIREGRHTGWTANVAPGFVQGNLAILPADWAGEFLRYCQLNPNPCPIVGRRSKCPRAYGETRSVGMWPGIRPWRPRRRLSRLVPTFAIISV